MIYLSIGRRERGKTTLMYHAVRKLRRRIIIDARRMISRSDVVYVRNADDLPDYLFDLMEDPKMSEVVYQPNEDNLDEAFIRWTLAIKHVVLLNPRQHLAIMVDEASFYPLADPAFQWLAKCTPRDVVHICITAHRPQDIPTSIRAIADRWFIFATTQEHDLRAIEQRTGDPRISEAVRRLQGRSYVDWDDARGSYAVVTNHGDWFVSMQVADHPKRIEVFPAHIDREWELEP